ncbi:MAG: TonB-dependent receptor [Magnetococcales bacterium]|nr:TonB-dependent receptor [Magnetococcales bacterium]
MNNKKRPTILTLVTLATLTPLSALAENVSEDSQKPEKVHSLDAVSVTASRVAEKVRETPVTIDIIDGKELEITKFTDSEQELLRRIPGNSLTRNLRIPIGGKNYTVNLVDGMAVNNFGGGTNSFIDESNTSDIERVEVIKGPASALYGSHALGGVINIITRKPPLTPEYKVWGEVGIHDRFRGGASAAGTFDNFGYFLDTNFLEYKGWQDRTAKERKAISGKIEKDIGTNALVTFRAEYLEKFQENPGYLTQAQFDSDWGQSSEVEGYKDERMLSAAASYERELSDMSNMKVSYSIRSQNDEGHPTYRNGADIAENTFLNHNLVATYQHDFDFRRSRIIAGADLQHSNTDNKDYFGRTIHTGVETSWEISAQVTSPFVQFEISPVEKLRVTVATRYDNINYDADDRVTAKDKELRFSNLTSKAGATWEIDADNSLWIGYGEGFVVPTSSQLFTSTSVTTNADLNPEKAQNYEFGLRGRLFSKRLNYEVALYHTTIEEMVVDGPANIYVNAGKVRVKGVESSIALQPVDSLRFNLTHTYARNQYIDFVDNGSDYSGNDLAQSPNHHINARVTWTPINNLEAELEWDHLSGYYTYIDNSADTAGKEERPDLVNLRLNYTKGPWSFWAHGLNIFDKKYATYVSYSPASRFSAAKRNIKSGTPLTVYTGLSYAF